MSLNTALSSALSGLQVNQKGLDLVSRNIANVNTPGYTKKLFNQESRILNGSGAGVQVSEVTRRVDFGLIEEINQENAKLSELMVKGHYLDRMHDMFGKPSDNNSIAHMIETLASEVEALALDPDKTDQHMAIVREAENVAAKLNDMTNMLQDLRLHADQEIERSVDEVNALLHDIQNLNEEISYSLATGRDATDLIDQRDLAVKNLSANMNIATFSRNSGELTVYTDGGDILVDREVKELSHTALSSVNAWQSKGGNDIKDISLNGADVTDDIKEGKLAALIEMRDSTLVDYQAQIDELTRGLRDTVNAVNNRGTSFPNLATEYTGTRRFIDPIRQTIKLDDGHDVVMTVFDDTGAQVATTTFRDTNNPALTVGTAILGSNPKALHDGDPYTVNPDDNPNENTVAGAIQLWLNDVAGGNLPNAKVTFNDMGQMEITLGDNNYSLAFQDVKVGTTQAEDATISFDADADASTVDTTHQGFASFLGLNDVYVTPRDEWAWDSGIKSDGWTPLVAGSLSFSYADDPTWPSVTIAASDTIEFTYQGTNLTTLPLAGGTQADVQNAVNAALISAGFSADDVVATYGGAGTDLVLTAANSNSTLIGGIFRDDSATTTTPAQHLNTARVSLVGNETIEKIAAKINNTATLQDVVEAEVVREGEGVRLRVKHRNGNNLTVTASSTTLHDALNMRESNAGLSNIVSILDDMKDNPSLISRGAMIWNPDINEYSLSAGDNSIANALADALRAAQTFEKAGHLSKVTRSLGDHAAMTLSLNASETTSNQTTLDYQSSLLDTLNMKNAEISAVNMDEELAQLLVYEKSYAASAKVIATTADLFDVLNSIV